VRYLIIPSYRVPEVVFAQVKEDGPAYLRYNNDNTKTFVKWDTGGGPDPECINSIVGAGLTHWGPYNKDGFNTEMQTDEWTSPQRSEPRAPKD